MRSIVQQWKLQKGLPIVPHLYIRDTWILSSRLTINSGTICEKLEAVQVQNCGDIFFFPKNNWRCLTTSEHSILSINCQCAAQNFSESMLIFSIPDMLHAKFWELDIETLFAMPDISSPEHDSQYRMYLADIINYMINDLGLVISGNCTCTVEVNKAGLKSTRYNPVYNIYTGLDIENFSLPPVNEQRRSQSVACINLGDEVSYLFFINLTLRRMLEMLGCRGLSLTGSTPAYGSSLAHLFLSTFPHYPVMRLAIMPGEGVLVPVEHIIHDGGTLGKAEPDVLLKVRACFAVEGG